MKPILFPLLLLLALPFTSTAQIAKVKTDHLDALKARQLIVVLREQDPETVKSYQKEPRKLGPYKKEIAVYNERIQKVAPGSGNLAELFCLCLLRR